MNQPRHTHPGFTLIEVVVVMLLLAIIAGTVGLNLSKDPASEVREEAERLAILINVARDQAILEGRFYGIRFNVTGYEFTRLNMKGELNIVTDDVLLRKREFSGDIQLNGISIDGKSIEIADSGFLVTPVGQFPAFIVSLSNGNILWQVLATEQGTVEAGPPDA
ncbi:MAG: prepilin-type N-terminal cleavage/methylation domain-containing protein [Acidiferrobacterales bacterium]